MPIIADIIIIAVLILALVIGVKRGLLGAIAGIVSVVAAFFGAALSASFLTPVVEQWLQPILMQKLEKRMQGAQTADGEAKRNDEEYMYVSCWKYTGDDAKPILIKEPLKYEAIKVQTRNYKS